MKALAENAAAGSAGLATHGRHKLVGFTLAIVGICLERQGSWHAPLFSVAVLYLMAAICWLRVDPSRTIEAADASGASTQIGLAHGLTPESTADKVHRQVERE
jgi:cyanate permease